MRAWTVATALSYLVLALPIAAWTTRFSRRAWAAGIFAAVVAMFVAVAANSIMPFDFYRHASAYLIEPFVERRPASWPTRGLLSAAFHVGAPVVFATVFARVRPPPEDY